MRTPSDSRSQQAAPAAAGELVGADVASSVLALPGGDVGAFVHTPQRRGQRAFTITLTQASVSNVSQLPASGGYPAHRGVGADVGAMTGGTHVLHNRGHVPCTMTDVQLSACTAEHTTGSGGAPNPSHSDVGGAVGACVGISVGVRVGRAVGGAVGSAVG